LSLLCVGVTMAHILVVEDSRLSRRMIIDILTESGHDTAEAIHGEDALELFRERRPDCVITDLLMPVMNGQGLLRRIRQFDTQVPIIVVSADIQRSTRSECDELGISGFLPKPVQAADLISCINNAFAQQMGVDNHAAQ